jgi:hypothetical protein
VVSGTAFGKQQTMKNVTVDTLLEIVLFVLGLALIGLASLIG